MKKTLPCKLKNTINELIPNDVIDIPRLKFIADNRLRLIQEIIELVHVYGYNEAKLKRALSELIRIESIRERKIVDFEYYNILLKTRNIVLSKTETELSCLIYNGFETAVLRMLYGHTNSESIYIRMHRIKQKLPAYELDKD